MKILLTGCLFILILSRASYATDIEAHAVPEIELTTALEEASSDQRTEFDQCLEDVEERNCVNEILGDIYN